MVILSFELQVEIKMGNKTHQGRLRTSNNYRNHLQTVEDLIKQSRDNEEQSRN